MKLIIGLGNPGNQYANTRHNIGFMAIDRLALSNHVSFRNKFQALIGETSISGVKTLLLKPQTYMNLSGRAVKEALSWYKLGHEDIVVIYDDMDIAFGKLKIRPQGGSGGHNGIKSIIMELGTENFFRIKIGIGRPPSNWDPVDYVLSRFLPTDESVLNDVLARAEQAVADILVEGITIAMNKHNG